MSSTTTTTAGVSAPVKRKTEIASPATPAKRGRKEKDKSKDKQNRDDATMLVHIAILAYFHAPFNHMTLFQGIHDFSLTVKESVSWPWNCLL